METRARATTLARRAQQLFANASREPAPVAQIREQFLALLTTQFGHRRFSARSRVRPLPNDHEEYAAGIRFIPRRVLASDGRAETQARPASYLIEHRAAVRRTRRER